MMNRKDTFHTIQRDLLQRFATNQLKESERNQITTLLQRFARGEMDESESKAMIDVLAEDAQGMTLLERIWAQYPIGHALAAVPTLDKATALRIRNSLIAKIQQSDTSNTAFKRMLSRFIKGRSN